MNMGVPTVVSKIPPHGEVAGEASEFFDPQNADELSIKVIKIINNKNVGNDLIEKGKEQAKKFSWQSAARKLLEIFENVR